MLLLLSPPFRGMVAAYRNHLPILEKETTANTRFSEYSQRSHLSSSIVLIHYPYIMLFSLKFKRFYFFYYV